MPQVVVEHRYGSDVDYELIKTVLNSILPPVFLLDGRELDPREEFDIDFREKSSHAQCTHELIVRIFVHATPERTKNTDRSARKVRVALLGAMPRADIGVSILAAEIGWSSDAYDRSVSRAAIGKLGLRES